MFTEDLQRVTVLCEKSGNSRARKEKTTNLSKRRHRASRKSNCPFKVVVVDSKRQGGIQITTVSLLHNHSPSKTADGRVVALPGDLTKEQRTELELLRASGTKPDIIKQKAIEYLRETFQDKPLIVCHVIGLLLVCSSRFPAAAAKFSSKAEVHPDATSERR